MTQIEIIKLEQDGCMPCKALSFAIDANKDVIAEAGAIVKSYNITQTPKVVNTDLAQDGDDEDLTLVDKFGISSTPVLIFFRNGVEMTRLAGKVAFAEVLDAIDYAKEAR